MPSYGLAEYLVVLTGMLLQSMIVIVMLRGGLHRQWPGFFIYTVFHIFQPIADIVGVVEKWNQLTYFYFFYSVEALSLSLSFVVIYEVFLSVLEPYDAMRRVGSKIFFCSGAALLLIGILFLIFGPASEGSRLFRIVFYSERSLRIVQVGLLLLLFAMSKSLGLSWRSNAFGIAMAYGVYASIQLVLVILRLKYVDFSLSVNSWCSAISFILACLIWLQYLVQRREVAQPIRVIPYNDIAKWNEKLEELLKPKTAKETDVEEEENDDQPVSK